MIAIVGTFLGFVIFFPDISNGTWKAQNKGECHFTWLTSRGQLSFNNRERKSREVDQRRDASTKVARPKERPGLYCPVPDWR